MVNKSRGITLTVIFLLLFFPFYGAYLIFLASMTMDSFTRLFFVVVPIFVLMFAIYGAFKDDKPSFSLS